MAAIANLFRWSAQSGDNRFGIPYINHTAAFICNFYEPDRLPAGNMLRMAMKYKYWYQKT